MEPTITTDIQDIKTENNNLNILRMKTCNVKTGKEKLMEAAQGFEAIFVTKLLNQMNSSSMNEGGFFGHTSAEKTFKGMLFQEIGKEVAKGCSFGIADAIYNQMKDQV